ncbi:MAG: magnesium transporter [Candidatus Heimdallarchaeota archaeon]|nr:MAG: hypothetical protein DRO91_07790 [Candidatus Heimdallarchaeota archaeon]RLI72550.1 MAG: hypothetical protein DRP02_01255 [Candidatus Gerdarchaeota archaeon]
MGKMRKIHLIEWFKKPTMLRIIFLIIAQAFIALLFDVFGLGAGSIGSYTFLKYASIFSNASAFIILLYPPLLSSDGGIGVLASHLGTSLHIGSIKPSLFKNTKNYWALMAGVLTLGVFNSLWIALISYITNLATLGPSRVLNPLPFIVIPILSLTMASLLSSQLTSLLAFFVFKRKLNPDILVYPTMSTINNILSTVFYALLIFLFKPANWFTTEGKWIRISRGVYFGLIPVILYLTFVIVLVSKFSKNKRFRAILKQAIPIQSITLTINSLTGGILSKAGSALTNYPGLFLIYPALIDTLGDEVSMVANTTSTHLSMGSIVPTYHAFKDKDLWPNFIGVGVAGLLLHVIYGVLGSVFAGDFAHIGVVFGIALLINGFGFLLILFVIFSLIIFVFKKGLDPDNLSVPIIASLSNLVVSTLLLLVSFVLT